MKKIAAFFDVDGTIFRNSLLIEHFKMLIKYEFIDESSFVLSIKDKLKKWEERRGNYDDYLDEVVESYVNYLEKIDIKDIEYVANQVINKRADKIYAYSRKKIKEHLNKGHLVIIISGSPSFLVEKMAKKLNATDSIGTIYMIENEKFTGYKKPMWDSESKIKAIEYFAEKYDIDLENSFAYGDTTGDFGMFTKVGNPVAINPAKKLFEKILAHPELKDKISIIIERKDMIYNLDANVKIENTEE